jgi:hypothetical protein
LKPKLIHNINVYEGSLHTNCWALLTDESAKIGGGEPWMGLGVDADVIDGKGKTLVSSLIDDHLELFTDRYPLVRQYPGPKGWGIARL